MLPTLYFTFVAARESFALGFRKFLGALAYKYCSIHGTELESRGFYNEKSWCRECHKEGLANRYASPYSKDN